MRPEFLSSPEIFGDMLAMEIRGATERESMYFEHMRGVVNDEGGQVTVVHGCDDSRVDVTSQVTWQPDLATNWNWRRNVPTLALFVPTIGAGTVDSPTMQAIVERLEQEGVSPKRISWLTTQHGSRDEVERAVYGDVDTRDPEDATCGLRKNWMNIINHTLTVPNPLSMHAGMNVHGVGLLSNGRQVHQHSQEMMGWLGKGIPVHFGLYDHSSHDIFVMLHGNKDDAVGFNFNQYLGTWQFSHQDPGLLVVSYGPRTVSVPDAVVLPSMVGTVANNDFSSGSAGEGMGGFERAMAEMWYPLVHLPGENGSTHDANFNNTSAMIVVADDADYAGRAYDFLNSSPFPEVGYSDLLRKLPSGVWVVDKSAEQAYQVQL